MIELSTIYRYPLKSAAAQTLDSAAVEPRGLAGDRRWMAVDENGMFLTGRKYPQLVLLRALLDEAGGLHLSHAQVGELRIATPGPDAVRTRVEVWGSHVNAALAGPAATDYLSRLLGRPAQLVHMDAAAQRQVDQNYARPGDEVSFADGYPMLLISQAALDQLNARASHSLEMLRFRPNLVASGCTAHAEDTWRRIRIGAVEFDVVKPCVRCVFTTVDSRSGNFDPAGEPLATLKSYRRSPKGITFGQNLVPRGNGTIRVGEPIEQLL